MVNIRVLDHLHTLIHDAGVFSEKILIGSALLRKVREIGLDVLELAPSAVLAHSGLLGERLAESHAELGSDVLLLDQFVLAVGEGTIVAVRANIGFF